MSTVHIRPLERDDRAQWEILWRAYIHFYNSSIPAVVYNTTWARFFDDGEYEPKARVAEKDGTLVGLVHFIPHRHCWKIENVIYLQDLFVSEAARGTGAGRGLIEQVYKEADEMGCPSVYWMTQDFNEAARKLYDNVATLTPFIKYQR